MKLNGKNLTSFQQIAIGIVIGLSLGMFIFIGILKDDDSEYEIALTEKNNCFCCQACLEDQKTKPPPDLEAIRERLSGMTAAESREMMNRQTEELNRPFVEFIEDLASKRLL